MLALTNRIRDYAWGSRTAIAAIQGRTVPAPGPEAELWLGAHPQAPSEVGPDRVPLPAAISADPLGLLGAGVLDEFGPRLPYLLKVLAADEPLSIQAHPDAEQARSGFAAESSLPAGDPARNYADPYHKPELLVALNDFDALCGFRDPALSADVLASFGVSALAPVVTALRLPDPGEALRTAVETLMAWPAAERVGLVSAVAAAAPSTSDDEYADSHELAADLAGRYPGDLGALVALLLNRVRLRPGQAVFMPAGNLHAYLHGVGIEIMAASDNVLRGGLTPKRVDVAELLRVLRFEVLADPVVEPVEVAAGVVAYRPPVREFELFAAAVDQSSVTLPGHGPRILLCVRGAAVLSTGSQTRRVSSGESVLVTAAEPAVTVGGAALVFQAGPAA
jgi:mannose-6-phosphate isomerase